MSNRGLIIALKDLSLDPYRAGDDVHLYPDAEHFTERWIDGRKQAVLSVDLHDLLTEHDATYRYNRLWNELIIRV